jgi:hypothetical protein
MKLFSGYGRSGLFIRGLLIAQGSETFACIAQVATHAVFAIVHENTILLRTFKTGIHETPSIEFGLVCSEPETIREPHGTQLHRDLQQQ